MTSHTTVAAHADTVDRPLRRLICNVRLRWACYAGAALVLAVLVFVPPHYSARAKILPLAHAVPANTDLVGGQTQSFATLFGGARASNDLYLIIARSDRVVGRVIDRLKLVGTGRPFATVAAAKASLVGHVDIHQLLGGVLEIQTTRSDPAAAQRLTEAYVGAIGDQLASFAPREAGASLQVIDPAQLDRGPQPNRSALALLAAVVLLAVFVEAYAPATGLFRLDVKARAL